jgi:hypothetical protein
MKSSGRWLALIDRRVKPLSMRPKTMKTRTTLMVVETRTIWIVDASVITPQTM